MEGMDPQSKLPVAPRQQPDPLDKKDPLLQKSVRKFRELVKTSGPLVPPPAAKT
jgi:hypothetical protein